MNAFSLVQITPQVANAAAMATAAREPNPAENVEKPGTMRTTNGARRASDGDG